MSISDSVTAVGLSKVIICPYLIQWISIRWSYVLIRFSDFGGSYLTSAVRLKVVLCPMPYLIQLVLRNLHCKAKEGHMPLPDSVTSVDLM